MQYSEIQTNFASILNRRDLTPSQTSLFLQFSIQRIQRVLRIPAMEAQLTLVTDGSANLLIPGDLLETIALFTDDTTNQDKLEKLDLQTVIRRSNVPGIPYCYCRIGAQWLIGHKPPAGTNIYISYYQDSSALSAPTDRNWLTDAAPDLFIYGALVRAADFFLDERKDQFEQAFTQALSDLQDQADRDELENASVGMACPTGQIDYGDYYG